MKLYELRSISESIAGSLKALVFRFLIKNFFLTDNFFTSLSVLGIFGTIFVTGGESLNFYKTGVGNLFSLLPNCKKSKLIFLSKSFLTSVKSLKCFSYYNNCRIKLKFFYSDNWIRAFFILGTLSNIVSKYSLLTIYNSD